eukprot:tig00001222_g7605.t1
MGSATSCRRPRADLPVRPAPRAACTRAHIITMNGARAARAEPPGAGAAARLHLDARQERGGAARGAPAPAPAAGAARRAPKLGEVAPEAVLSSRSLLQVLLKKYPDFQARINDVYPGAVLGRDFVRNTGSKLASLGFSPANAIPCICLCRDEICQPFYQDIQKQWATRSTLGAFNMSSLAGILNIGKTGLVAAQSHAPVRDGTERYVFYGFTHVAIGEAGEVGVCTRPGRPEPSSACGALLAVQDTYKAGPGAPGGAGARVEDLDADDVEAGLVCRAVRARLPPTHPGGTPSLEAITSAACEELSERMARLIELTTRDRACNYALFTGVQIHGPDGNDYVFPRLGYAMVEGRRHEVTFDGRPAFGPPRSKLSVASSSFLLEASHRKAPSKESLLLDDAKELEGRVRTEAAEAVTVVQAF